MNLASHITANREFFAKGKGPSRSQWEKWVLDGTVQGKVIDGKVFVDLDFFASREVMRPSRECFLLE